MIRVGQQVSIGQIDGEVVKVGHVSVEVSDGDVIHDVPHTHFLEDGSARVSPRVGRTVTGAR